MITFGMRVWHSRASNHKITIKMRISEIFVILCPITLLFWDILIRREAGAVMCCS